MRSILLADTAVGHRWDLLGHGSLLDRFAPHRLQLRGILDTLLDPLREGLVPVVQRRDDDQGVVGGSEEMTMHAAIRFEAKAV